LAERKYCLLSILGHYWVKDGTKMLKNRSNRRLGPFCARLLKRERERERERKRKVRERERERKREKEKEEDS
jgi:hypothetical protein